MFEHTNRRYLPDGFGRFAGEAPGGDNSAARERYRRFALAAVRHLPPKRRAVVELYYFESLRLDEIAQRLGISKSTASRRLCAARRALRELAGLCREAGLLPS